MVKVLVLVARVGSDDVNWWALEKGKEVFCVACSSKRHAKRLYWTRQLAFFSA